MEGRNRHSSRTGRLGGNLSLVAISVFLLATGHQLAKVGRDALFVQERGLWDLPTAYLGIALLAGPLAALALTSMRLVGPRATRPLLSLLASGVACAENSRPTRVARRPGLPFSSTPTPNPL